MLDPHYLQQIADGAEQIASELFEGFTEEEARALVEEAQPKEEPGFFQEE